MPLPTTSELQATVTNAKTGVSLPASQILDYAKMIVTVLAAARTGYRLRRLRRCIRMCATISVQEELANLAKLEDKAVAEARQAADKRRRPFSLSLERRMAALELMQRLAKAKVENNIAIT